MSKKILVLGVGALGSWIAANLAIDLKDKAEIAVLDFDKVEPRNWQAGTQFYRSDQREKFKIDALQFNIYKWLGIKIDTYNYKLNKGDLLPECNLIVDVFDNYDSRKLIHDYCQKVKMPCVHIGFSPERTFEIAWDANYQVPNDRKTDFDICTTEGARSFIQFVAGLGSTVIQEFIQSGKMKNLAGNRFSISSF